ncbi:MAG: glycosyltransferase family 2 protein [Nitrososphaerota archaeon]
MSSIIELVWYTPFAYTAFTVAGQLAYRIRKRRLGKRRRVSKIIFQIPTIGNVEECNRILRTVRSYNLPVPLETWILIDEGNYRPEMRFECDRLVIVPSDFRSKCLYKSRSLEYARRLRVEMWKRGELDDDYIVVQCDDDSTPSREFLMEVITVDADMVIGTITPRPTGHLVADYERPVACNMTCLLFTNIGHPVWGHGEGMSVSARADREISYEPHDAPLISSEDLFYLHKIAHALAEDMYVIQKAAKNHYRIFASKERVYITPPLSVSDAVKQRRRWLWGHIRLIRNRMLPASSLVTIAIAESIGLLVYATATAGAVLVPLGVIQLPSHSLILSYISLALWHGFRGFCVGRVMGLMQGLRAAVLSFVTVTLNFAYHIIGLVKGDPRRFEVIKKYVPPT